MGELSWRGRQVVEHLHRGLAAVEATPEIGPRAAAIRYGFHHRELASVQRASLPRIGPRYIDPPPDDLVALGRRLGYSRKDLMRMEAKHGEEGLRDRLQTEWRQSAQERAEYLPQNAARPPTTNPADSIEDGQIARITPAMEKRLRDEKRAVWERERDRMNEALDNLQAAGLNGGELFVVRKRLEALDRRLSEAA